MLSRLGVSALWWARYWGPVFPLVPNAKIPLISREDGGHGYLDATRDPERIAFWWNREPNANIGGACGGAQRTVIDVDLKSGGVESFNALALELGPELFATNRHRTPSGGFHYIFAAGEDPLQNSTSVIAPGIDVRGFDGYVGLPPSLIGGVQYTIEYPTADYFSFPPLVLPAGIRERLARNGSLGLAKPPFEMPDRILKGTRRSTMLRMAGLLRDRGASGEEILSLLTTMNTRCVDDDLRPDPLPEDEVKALAYDVERRYTPTRPVVQPEQQKQPRPPEQDKRLPRFVSGAELLAEPDEQAEHVVTDLLRKDGTAILVGRPKHGKSTTALNIARCVVRGEPFLGRDTFPGVVLYLALEGSRGYWKAKIRRMGLSDENFRICIDRAPEGALQWLREEVERSKPVLVIVDTMQRLLRVAEGNDYALGSNATDAIIELARLYHACVLLLHHSGKRRQADIVDEVLGSTAWAAAVDCILLERYDGRRHTLASEQRDGTPLEETIVALDAATETLSAGGTKREADVAEMAEEISSYVKDYGEAHPEQPNVERLQIEENVEGSTSRKRAGLREAIESGRVQRSGKGTRGDPFQYSFSCSPMYIEHKKTSNEDEDPGGEESADALLDYAREKGLLDDPPQE